MNRHGHRHDSIQPAVLAGCLTTGLFLALPFVHVVERRPEPALDLLPLQRAEWQAPPPLPPPSRERPQRDTHNLPEPELERPRQPVTPLKAVLDFDFGTPGLEGDFDLAFSVEPTGPGAAARSAFNLTEVDRAPQPLVQLRPLYPTHARMRKLEGEVLVEFVVSRDGQTEHITVLSTTPGNIFRKAAVRAIARWRFSPAMRQGEPVPVRVQQRIRFRLEEVKKLTKQR